MTGGLPVVSRRSVGSQIRLLIGILVILVPIGADHLRRHDPLPGRGGPRPHPRARAGPRGQQRRAARHDPGRGSLAARRPVGVPATLDPLTLQPAVEHGARPPSRRPRGARSSSSADRGPVSRSASPQERGGGRRLVRRRPDAVPAGALRAGARRRRAGRPRRRTVGGIRPLPARPTSRWARASRPSATPPASSRARRRHHVRRHHRRRGAVVVLVLVAAGFGMDRAVGRPLARLREVVRRQAEEDVIAMANQEEGALEVRMLARDFNDLTRANARLVDQQAAVLEMQELVLDVGRGARSAVDVHEALQRVATKLGAGLGADRVLLYTLGEDGQTIEDRLQWHTDDLPDLPPLPRSLAQQVGAVNDELRRDVGFFDLGDLLAAPGLRRRAGPRLPPGHRGPARCSCSRSAPAAAGLGILSVMMVERAAALAPPRDPGRAAVRGHRRPVDRRAAPVADAGRAGAPAHRARPAEDRLHGDRQPRAAHPADLDQRLPRAARRRRLRRRHRRPARGPRHHRAQRHPAARPHRGPPRAQQDRDQRPAGGVRGGRRPRPAAHRHRDHGAGRRQRWACSCSAPTCPTTSSSGSTAGRSSGR